MLVRHPAIARKRLRIGVLLAFACAAACSAASAGSAENDSSDDYIVGFVRYVHWPDEDAARAWTVCVAGLGANERDARYANERVRGKPFAWRAVDGAQDLDGCHVLDLTRADAATSAALLVRGRGRPLLSVGRGADFCTAGGLICLHEPGDERAFEVNLSAIKESGLGVSARLLRLGSARAPQGGAP
jgi:hypothetical protein